MERESIEQLIKAAQLAGKMNLCKHRSGNFSVINRARTEIAITPSGVNRDTLTVDDIPILNRNGEVIVNPHNRTPSSEWSMHLTAYETRKDFQAVAHTHSVFATTFSIKGEAILPVVFEAYFYGWKTGVTAQYQLPGSRELADSIRRPLETTSAVLLRNHGVLIGGNSPTDAVEKAAYIEEVAEIYHHYIQLYGPDNVPVIAEEAFFAYRRQNEGL